jgi:hypothetical protein
MQIVSTVVGRSLDACWRVFTDPTQMTAWVPGLRVALVIETGEDGLPREVQFEFATDLLYSLDYTYDLDAHVVSWEPRAGETGAVRGFARFDTVDDGTQVTYALEHEAGRKAAERAIDNPRLLVDAFARLMHET